MKASRIPGLLDVIEASDLNEIKAVSERPEIDRQFSSRLPLLNGLLLSNLLATLSYRGKRFPTMLPRLSASRAHDQKTLRDQLSAKVSFYRGGPLELESVAVWLKGTGEDQEVAILLQQLVGRAFEPSYKASEESWAAAVMMAAATRIKNPLKLFSWKISGRIRSSRNTLAAKVAGDRAAIHGTGIAIHNLVAALKAMKALYSDIGLRESLSPEEATHRSLAAPVTVLRQATAAGSISGCPFKRGTLFVLKLNDAFKRSGDDGIVFQRESWSRCPAEQWVPALLAGIWVRATNRR